MATDKKKRTPAKRQPNKKAPSVSVEEVPSPVKNVLRIVGIGASAGGLEALEQLFTHLPSDSGMAFVIVQHLDPTRESSMPEILSRLTKMPVHVATDGMKIEPNSVYLIPPDRNIGTQDGSLYLQEVAQPRGLRLPVDFFLRSLAKDKGPDAICIILSGTGTDGTLGLRAIKAEAGTAFVQELETARYDGMPRSAIDTGLADFILPAGLMPQKLIDFVKHYAANDTRISAATKQIQEPMQQIFAIMRTRTGHDFSHYKQSTIRRRLQRRMSVNSILDVSDYAGLLRSSDVEVKALLKDILISVTSFFRDPEAFDALKDELMGLIKTRDLDSDLRVWVAGCATGEEAYSIAILVAECLDELEKHFPVQIYATDIDTDALSLARAGIYPANITADVTPERLRHFFIKEDKGYRVKKEIRDMVVFAPQDLIKDPPFSRMDLICCRNLLIYLEGEVQKRLTPLLHYALKPGGLLFLGTSEGINEATDLFSVREKKWKIFQRRETVVAPERLRFPVAFTPYVNEPAAEQAARLTAARLPELSEKIFLDNYAPTFAVIDEKYRLIYVRGRTGKYLEIASGQPSLSIMEMAREGLRPELTSALYQVTSSKKLAVREGIQVRNNGGFQTVNLTVVPLGEHGMPSGLMMVVFQEAGPVLSGVEGPAKKPAARGSKRTAGLEGELKLTRESLQSTIEELESTNEELKSANEELQSNNEELQSTNEELDTSREELQSINEELLTVNAELSSKTGMLAKANDDLKNYLNRTDIAIIFLDEELKIRSYTPATADVFNIREVDIGRPLDEITSRLAYESVVDNAREVLRTLTAKEIEVRRKDGHWYNMRILPYRTVQNALGGLVMSFLDINKFKIAEESVKVAQDWQETFDAMPDMISIHDRDYNILRVNEAFARAFGMTREELVGKKCYEVFHEGNAPALGCPHQLTMKTGQLTHEEIFEPTRNAYFDISTVPVLNDRGEITHSVHIARDITERKQAGAALQESERMYRSLFENMLNGFAYCKMIFEQGKPSDFVYLSVNSAFEILTGLKNVVGKRVSEVIPGIQKSDPELFEIYGRVASTGIPERFETYVHALEMWFSISVYSPEKEYFVAVFEVITERKKSEQIKDEFIGLISHELRTPLTIITGSLHSAMYRGVSPEDVRELLQNAAEGADSLADILENMLELSRHQAGRLQLHMEPADIADSAQRMISKLKRQGAGQRFLIELPADLPMFEADQMRMDRVLYNLLENAVKYSPEASEIKVTGRAEGDFIITSVVDQGRGISPEDMTKLFEPFQQLETTSRPTRGVGLGLVVCKRLVEAQGGWIKVDSAVGQGSTFSFALPIRRAKP